MATKTQKLVVHFPGYEPTSAEKHYLRFYRECDRFCSLWKLDQEIGELQLTNGIATWQVTTTADGWSTSTRIVVPEWRTFMSRPHENSFWRKVTTCFPAYLRLFTTDAPIRYFKANWRYGLYTLQPLFLLALFAAMGFGVTAAIHWLIPALPGSLELAIASVSFFLFTWLFGQRWGLPLVLDLSDFTEKLAVQKEDNAEERIEEFAMLLQRELQNTMADEIVISTHSYGSVFAAASLARAMRNDPQLLKNRKITIIALASNMGKLGLMNSCQWLKQDLKTVLSQPGIQWGEIYVRNDLLCFNDFGPDRLIDEKPVNPLISKRVRLSAMISRKRYNQIRFKAFQLHRQLVMANEMKYFYDYYVMVFGPVTVSEMLNSSHFEIMTTIPEEN